MITMKTLQSDSLLASSQQRIRLDFLDGIRGIAALYVLIHHIYREINWRLEQEGNTLPPVISKILPWILGHGSIPVAIFIVLSGYCLMLPVIRSGTKRMPMSMPSFFKRRAKRILPPYYAALILSLVPIAIVPREIGSMMGLHWRDAQTSSIFYDLLSHLLLIHNLREEWTYKINGVMWTIATEWQIYFFFPLLLIPLWRQFGITFTVIVAFILGLTPHYLFNGYLDWSCPWYLGLFSLGMAGAIIGFSQEPRFRLFRDKFPWLPASNGFTATIFIILLRQRNSFGLANYFSFNIKDWQFDLIIGFLVVCLLIYFTKFSSGSLQRPHPILLRFLETKWVVTLGTFSYSLYLIHAPILGVSQLLVNNLYMPIVTKLFIMSSIAIILSLSGSYLFHVFFERPFMNSHK